MRSRHGLTRWEFGFRTDGQKQDVTLRPLNTLFDRRYALYWQVSECPPPRRSPDFGSRCNRMDP